MGWTHILRLSLNGPNVHGEQGQLKLVAGMAVARSGVMAHPIVHYSGDHQPW